MQVVTQPLNGLDLGGEMANLLLADRAHAFPTIADELYVHIWRKLVNQEFRPGERLSDSALAEEFSVSRTPLREALARLAQDGLLVATPRRGYYVSQFSPRDVEELYDLRQALEVLATRLATPRVDETALRQMLALLHDVRARLQEEPREDFLRSDLRLHQLLVRTSGYPRLARLLVPIQVQISLFQVMGAHLPGFMTTALDEHERIIEALLRRDAAAAAAAMANHIAQVKVRTLAEITTL